MTSPSRIITLMQNKGGVGKTTITLTLAAAAAARGLSVLVVDADQQTNATLLLDPEGNSTGDFTIYDMIANGEVGIGSSVALPTAWNTMESIRSSGGRVNLIAGDTQMNDSHVAKYPLTALANTLKLDGEYNLILIDCPPSTGLVVQAALAAADYALIVTQPQHLSVWGIQQSMTLIEQFNETAGERNPVIIAGIIVNQIVQGQVEHKDSLAEMTQAFGELIWTPTFSSRAVMQRAMAAHYPITEINDPKAKEITKQAHEILTKLLALGSTPDIQRLTVAEA
jgi:chromosome partitioning protein